MNATVPESPATLDSTKRDWLKKMGECLGVSSSSSNRNGQVTKSANASSQQVSSASRISGKLLTEFERIDKALDELIAKHKASA